MPGGAGKGVTVLHPHKLTLARRVRFGWVTLAVMLAAGTVRATPDSDPSVIPPGLDTEAVEDAIDDAGAGLDAGPRGYDQGELRLADVKSGRSLQQGREAINPLRAEALKESALAYGARAGLYARMREINRLLDEDAGALDKNFPFAPLILSHNVVPPVIQSGRDTVRQHHAAQLQFADAVFEIVAPAKLAVAPPDWRTYLYVRAARPEPPDETLLPDRSKAAEVELWERSVERGWRRGVRQADRTFTIQLNRLERDLTGMAQYRELLAKNVVTPPRLTEQQRGVTTTGNRLLVNDRLLEIAENTRFVIDNQRWTPYPTRPYQPPRHTPKVNLIVLGVPAGPPPATQTPSSAAIPRWELPPWQR